MSSCRAAFALDLRTASLNPLTQQRAIVILDTLSHDSFAKLAAPTCVDRSLVPYRASRTCALDKCAPLLRGTLYPAPNLAPKTACTSAPMLKLLPYPWAGARKLHSDERNYHTCSRMWYEWECELAFSTKKTTFSKVQERMWGKHTELNQVFKRFRVRPGRVVEIMDRWAP